MAEIWLTSLYVVYPTIYRVSAPSQVQDFSAINSITPHPRASQPPLLSDHRSNNNSHHFDLYQSHIGKVPAMGWEAFRQTSFWCQSYVSHLPYKALTCLASPLMLRNSSQRLVLNVLMRNANRNAMETKCMDLSYVCLRNSISIGLAFLALGIMTHKNLKMSLEFLL